MLAVSRAIEEECAAAGDRPVIVGAFHWEPKARKGPSDPQAAKSGKEARRSRDRTTAGWTSRGARRTT